MPRDRGGFGRTGSKHLRKKPAAESRPSTTIRRQPRPPVARSSSSSSRRSKRHPPEPSVEDLFLNACKASTAAADEACEAYTVVIEAVTAYTKLFTRHRRWLKKQEAMMAAMDDVPPRLRLRFVERKEEWQEAVDAAEKRQLQAQCDAGAARATLAEAKCAVMRAEHELVRHGYPPPEEW